MILFCLPIAFTVAKAGDKKDVQTRDAGKKVLLKKYDLNKNGKLDKEEVEQIGRDRLLRFDRNKDGKVDQIELKKMADKSQKMMKMTKHERETALNRAKQDQAEAKATADSRKAK